MKSTRYVIGMDGGGTKTVAIIAALDGTIIAEHVAGPTNFQFIGVEKAAQTIYSLICDCCNSAGCTVREISAVTLGLAGAGRTGDQKRMADGLRAYAVSQGTRLKEVIVDSDARIALEGAFKGGPGIIVIAGTGSIAFGKDRHGVIHRVGGWGRILGDEGSGFFIGRAGLTAVTRYIDGRGEKTSLTKLVAEKFCLSDQTEIITAVYQSAFDVASIAPLVLEAAMKNDQVSRLIVEQASTDLTNHVRALGMKITPPSRRKVREKIPVSLIGGLIANDTLLRRMLLAQMELALPHVQVTEPLSVPAYGAVVMSIAALDASAQG
ncbi:MAG TPA: BadF/BadG/BcrA/BcrD ATPase family protein [Bacteroidota bacterium]|nr:BadF/BadG/BcrA/BcrD ATPase family protein [Bacteroidota bacterium]